MPQNTVDDARICNKRNDAHAAAARAKQRVRLENSLDQASPGAAGFPGAIRIVRLAMFRPRRGGVLILIGRHANPRAVRVCTIESLTLFSRIGNVGRDAMNPFERVQLKVCLKQLIESRAFGMPWMILRRRFRNHPARNIFLRATIGLGSERTKDNRLRPEEHDRQQTSCGFQAAKDLIARETIEPIIYQPLGALLLLDYRPHR